MALILGIDPGLTRCGIAVLESDNMSLLFSHVLKTSPDAPLENRIGTISQAIESVLDDYEVVILALERVFAQANVKSVMGVAQISGAVMASAHARGIPVEFFTPSEVKLSICGNGRAAKNEVIAAVSRFFPNQLKTKHPDEADAVAIAFCASRRGSANKTPAQRAWMDASKVARGKLG